MEINLIEESRQINVAFQEIQKEYNAYFHPFNSVTKKEKKTSSSNGKPNINFYDYYAFLFFDEFKDIPLEKYRKLTLGGILYYKYILWNDTLIDTERKVDSSAIIYSNFLLKKSYDLLYSLFDPLSVYWSYFEQYLKEFTDAVLLEQIKHVGILSEYSQKEFETIAKGKSALAKTATTALAVLCDMPEKIEPLEKAQDYFNIAIQLYDDLQDWKKDYKTCHYSHLLTNVIYNYNLSESVESNNPPDLETIGRALYLSEAAEKQMKDAILFIEKAIENSLNCKHWIETIKRFQYECQTKGDNIAGIRTMLQMKQQEKQSAKTKRKLGQDSLSFEEQVKFHISQALDYILTQQELDFPELKRRQGQSRSTSRQINVFEQALIVDTLIDAQSVNPDTDEAILTEIKKLIAAKSAEEGWRRFIPNFYELPPDVDTLGQILQIMSRSKCDKMKEEVSFPISLILSKCSYDDGSFDTWIVNKNDEKQERTVNKNSKKQIWKMSRGKDDDVLANILYGLYLYDFTGYKDRIKKGVNCLEQRQTKEGYWTSKWYWGNYYCTYAAIRIIHAVDPNSQTLKNAEKFIITNQNYDGGWGYLGSDALNTALALLSLALLNSDDYQSIINGVHYLFNRQNKKGFWDKIEFLKLETKKNNFTYRSKTITTQFCLKALLALKNHIFEHDKMFSKIIQSPRPTLEVFPIYKDFFRCFETTGENKRKNYRNLIESNYVKPNIKFFNELFKISSLSKKDILDRLVLYKKEEYLNLFEQMKEQDTTLLAKKCVSRCYKMFPLNKIPYVYLWIGPAIFRDTWFTLENNPIIIISLEYWADIQQQLTAYQTYLRGRCDQIQNGIKLAIANQYCKFALHLAGFSEKSVSDKLYKEGLVSYFTRMVFPEISLASHLVFTTAELEWCQRNERIIKAEFKSCFYYYDSKKLDQYFTFNPDRKGQWFPNRVATFIGYKIIDECFNQEDNLTIRDLFRESPIELIDRSKYFSDQYKG